ncbi:GPCR kinase [Tanacetum coccineum]
MLFPSSVPDTELVLYPLQDKLTSRDKSLELSAFKLSRLFFSLLSSGSSSFKSCSRNALGDLTVTMKDLSGTIPGTIHHKVIGEGGYGKDITIGAALILANVCVFSLKPSMHYLNITNKNVVKVFRKDTVPESGSGSG